MYEQNKSAHCHDHEGVPDCLGVDVHWCNSLQQKLHHLQEGVCRLLGVR